MPVLAPEIHGALAQLLSALSSSENEIRSKAEEQLNVEWVATQPDVLLMGLVEQMHESQDPSTRSFAAVLFRRMSTKTRKVPDSNEPIELFMTLQEPQRNAIRSRLIQCMQSESIGHVRNKVGDAVAEIARQYSDDGQSWNELLGALFQASQSTDAGQREGAFRIFATTPGIIEKQHEETVQSVFAKGFRDDNIDVKIGAMEAFASFFRALQKKSQKRYYGAVADILNIIPPLKDNHDSDNLTKALYALIELAEIAPLMFKTLFRSLVQFSITVIQDKELSDQARQNALELMATFAECSPDMCRDDPSYTTDMVTQCLSLMTDVGLDDDDASEWQDTDDIDVEESDLNHVAGEQCMDRLANKLKGKTLLAPTFGWLPRMVQSLAWRDRHAALMAISAISEGCREHMEGELNDVLSLVIPALQDPHPRVRWAGCNALGQMSTDFAPLMQEKYHTIVLTNIIPVLDAPWPRVQSHAAAALVNFCEEAEKEVLEPYLEDLLNHLLNLLQNPKRYVMEQALSTIATIADSAETAFGRYYDTLMPLLFNSLKGEQSKEFRLLRAKAMECATLIALAVGKERMGQDALDLVQLLGIIQSRVTDADDPQAQYLLHCWGRMCRVLKQDFIPYLPTVMPPLLELAKAKADITLLDNDEATVKSKEEEGWEMVPLKGKYIGIKTSILEDKHVAIELIYIYAQQLEVAFEPYVVDIMYNVSLPGLAFFFHDAVRIASAKTVPVLLNAYKKAHGDRSQDLEHLWESALEKILEVLTPELAIDTLAEMYQCFYESIEVIGSHCLGQRHMEQFIIAAKKTLEEYQIRVQQRLEAKQELEEDEEETEEVLLAIEDDQTLLSDMNKAFHTIFKHHGQNFLPAWATLIPFYGTFVTNEIDPTQRQWALCIMDDVLEFCDDESWAYQTTIQPALNAGMKDPNPANRQAACYGVGIAAQKGGSQWAPFVIGSLDDLFKACHRKDARADDDVFATENACASIAKILRAYPDKVANIQNVVAQWINTLPVVNDEEAAPFAYMFLSQLIEQRNPAVLAAADKSFIAICQALEAETIQGQTLQHVTNAAKVLVQATGLNADALLSTLQPETQQTVRAHFS